MTLVRHHQQPDAAKRAYFRGISSCPWSKDLWLHALRVPSVRQLMSPQELWDVVDTLNGKGGWARGGVRVASHDGVVCTGPKMCHDWMCLGFLLQFVFVPSVVLRMRQAGSSKPGRKSVSAGSPDAKQCARVRAGLRVRALLEEVLPEEAQQALRKVNKRSE